MFMQYKTTGRQALPLLRPFSSSSQQNHNGIESGVMAQAFIIAAYPYRFGLLGVNASATARVISRRWNDDEISFLVEETGVPGGNHRPTASNWWNFSHIRPLPSPGIELRPQRCEAKWAKARWESVVVTGLHTRVKCGKPLLSGLSWCCYGYMKTEVLTHHWVGGFNCAWALSAVSEY